MATLDTFQLKKQKHQRAMSIIFISIGQLLIAPYFASVIHQWMFMIFNLGTFKYKGNYHYRYALQGLVAEPGIRLWFILLEAAYFLYIVWLILKPSAVIKDVREVKITDTISIPVPIGNGQHGNARFTTPEEMSKLFESFVFKDIHSRPNGKGGLVVGAVNKQNEDKISYIGKDLHALIIGATGAGKTRRVLLESVCVQLLAGSCTVISDVKGEIYYYTHKFAEQLGYKTIVVDLCNPSKSDRYNYLQPIIAAIESGRKEWINKKNELENKKRHIKEEKALLKKKLITNKEVREIEAQYQEIAAQAAAIEKEIKEHNIDYSWTKDAQTFTWDLVSVLVKESTKGEPLWYNGESATLAACILAVCMEAKREYQNLYNVYLFLAYMGRVDEETGASPLTAYLETLSDQHPAKFIFMQSQAAAERTRSSFYTSVLGDLRLFTDPSIADMTASSDFALSEIGTQKVALYLLIPDEKKTYYPLAAALINQLYVAQVKEARNHGGSLPLATEYDLDEIGNFPTIPVLSGLLSAGRSRNIRANLIVQDYQQLETKYKDDIDTIKACCRVKIYLKSDNTKTLEEISKMLGKYTVEVTSASNSTSVDKLNDYNISNSSNMTGRELLMPSEVAQINQPYALVMVTGERPSITRLPDLSCYRFNSVLGLGNEEHNRKLIEQYEQERPERDISYPPQWGMWVEFKAKLEAEAAKNLDKSRVGMGFSNI
ncbi:MAG: type IV secretory system conjugative DNA transfer family protein [Clostridium sp.]|nr:type IV secretory system conjugative DNA transfer family protein [Clostridium sp.]